MPVEWTSPATCSHTCRTCLPTYSILDPRPACSVCTTFRHSYSTRSNARTPHYISGKKLFDVWEPQVLDISLRSLVNNKNTVTTVPFSHAMKNLSQHKTNFSYILSISLLRTSSTENLTLWTTQWNWIHLNSKMTKTLVSSQNHTLSHTISSSTHFLLSWEM